MARRLLRAPDMRKLVLLSSIVVALVPVAVGERTASAKEVKVCWGPEGYILCDGGLDYMPLFSTVQYTTTDGDHVTIYAPGTSAWNKDHFGPATGPDLFWSGDPVNAAGEFVLRETDLSLPGFGIDFSFERTYRSRSGMDGPLGYGWDFNYNQQLVPGDCWGDPVLFTTGGLEVVRFYPDSHGTTAPVATYTADPFVPLVLERRSQDALPWVMRDPNGVTRRFDADGHLRTITDLAGHELGLTWSQRVYQRAGEWHCGGVMIHNVFHPAYCTYPQIHYWTLDSITDTTGRTIYLRWTTPVTVVEGFENVPQETKPTRLECLTLDPDPSAGCAGALATYVIPKKTLDRVNDALGHGTSYGYVGWTDNNDHYLADDAIDRFCHEMCNCPNICSELRTHVAIRQDNGDCMDWDDCMTDHEDPYPYCEDEQGCDDACNIYHQNPGAKQYGQHLDRRGNMVSVTNADGVRVVRNVYGNDPTSPAFDRVVEQYLGPVDRLDRKLTWEYHDLVAEHDAGVTGTNGWVQSSDAFRSEVLCECLAWDSSHTRCVEYAPARTEDPPPPSPLAPVQDPAHAVVIRDLRGVVRTRYLSDRWKVLREVNHHVNDTGMPEVTNYNYDTIGRAVGHDEPSGVRTCRNADERDRTLATTRLPRPGHDDLPQATHYAYDSDGLLSAQTDDALGTPSHTTYTRMYGQVYSKREEITPGVFATTSYSYPWFGWRLSSRPGQVVTPWGTTTYDFCRDIFGSRHCGPLPGMTVTNPEGVATTTYAYHDSLGRPTIEGTWDAYRALSYDAAGRIYYQYRVDPDGEWESVHYSYSNLDQPTIARSAKWRRATRYDTLGNVVELLEEALDGSAAPRRRCWDRDLVDGRVLAEIQPEGDLIRYFYDDAGRPLATERGFPTTQELAQDWAQPCAGNIAQNDSPDRTPGVYETIASYDYDAGGRLSYSQENGIPTHYVRDGFDRVREEIRGDGSVLRRGWDSRNRVRWEATHAPNPPPYAKPSIALDDYSLVSMTEWSYDLLGRQTRVDRWHFAAGLVLNGQLHARTDTAYLDDLAHTTTSREARNTVTITQGANTTTRILDGAGRVIEERLPDGFTVIRRTWLDDRTVVETAPNPNGVLMTTRRVHDARGRLRDVYDGQGVRLFHEEHDVDDRPTFRTTAEGADSWTTYDAFGRAIREQRKIDDHGRVVQTSTEWDRNDAIVAVVDGRMARTRQRRDALGRVVQEIDPSGRTKTTWYQWGTTRPWFTTDSASGTDTMLFYDGRGRLAYEYVWDGENLPTAGGFTSREHRYTAHGLRNHTGEYRYLPDGPVVTWQTVDADFDSHGNRVYETSSTTPDMEVRHTHDGFGHRLTTTVGSDTIQYINEPLGRPSWVNINGRRVVYINYAAAGGPNMLYYGWPGWDFAPTPADVRTYDLHGRLTDQTLTRTTISGNESELLGLMHTAYDVDGAPRQRASWLMPHLPVTDYFQVDRQGRVIGENRMMWWWPLHGDQTNDSVAFAFGCSVGWVPNGVRCGGSYESQPGLHTYWLDDAHNWQYNVAEQTIQAMQVGAVNELVAFESDAASNDANGNLTELGDRSYVHDAAGRMLEASNGATTIVYGYDAIGRRVTESDGTRKTYLVWDGDELLAIGSTTGTSTPPASAYTLRIGAGLDTHLALYERSTQRLRYLHQGPDGSVLAVTDDSGLLEGNVYTAFGERRTVDRAGNPIASSAQGNRFGFQGQLDDPALDGVWMRSREYLPSIGRFVAQDPIGLAGGLNLYSFVSASPLTHVDPFGHDARRRDAATPLPSFYSSFHLVPRLELPMSYGAPPHGDEWDALFPGGSQGVTLDELLDAFTLEPARIAGILEPATIGRTMGPARSVVHASGAGVDATTARNASALIDPNGEWNIVMAHGGMPQPNTSGIVAAWEVMNLAGGYLTKPAILGVCGSAQSETYVTKDLSKPGFAQGFADQAGVPVLAPHKLTSPAEMVGFASKFQQGIAPPGWSWFYPRRR